MITEQSKVFCNILFLLAFLADQNIFWSRPGIYANLFTLFLTTKNEEPRTLNSQDDYLMVFTLKGDIFR